MWRNLWENPIFWRMRRADAGLPGTRRFLRRYGGYLAVIFLPFGITLLMSFFFGDGLWPTNLREWRELAEVCLMAAIFFQLIYVTFRAVSGTSSAVSLEKEQQTWAPLVSSRLTPAEIAAGKLLGGLWPTARELLFGFPLLLGLGFAAGAPAVATRLLVVSLAALAFFGLLGFVASLHWGKSANANRWATTLTAVVIFGTMVLDELFGTILGLSEFVPLTSSLSPLVAGASVLINSEDPGAFLWDHLWCLTVVLYTVFAVSMWRHCVSRLTRPV